MLLAAGMPGIAQEMESVNLFYTGNLGAFFRDWKVPPGTRYSVRKTTPDELKKLSAKNEVRLAVSTVPLDRAGLKSRKFAYQAVILAVHPANRLDNLSTRQARDLLEKNTGSWRSFGGPRARLRLYIKAKPELPPPVMRHDHTHDRSMPRTILTPEPLGGAPVQEDRMPPRIKYSQPLKIQTESDAKSFAMLCTDPLGLACFDITRYDETRVRILSIDKIPPTLENFRFSSYPLLTIYYLTVPDTPSAPERKLIDFLLSRKFAARLYRAGMLPEMPNRK